MKQVAQTLKQGRRPTLGAVLRENCILAMAGISDGLSARLAQQAGFSATYLSGGALARGMGYPDLGLVTLSELELRVRNIAEVSSLPFLVDLDSGFGGALNLQLAVTRIERAGAAGVHIDDFEVPRRAGNVADNLIPLDAMLQRLMLAMDARRDRDFMIIGRTDAAVALGLDEAIRRASAFADLGVDMVYIEHLHDRAAMERVAREISAPKMISIVAGKGDTPTSIELEAMGFSAVSWPAEVQLGAIAGAVASLKALARDGVPVTGADTITFEERDQIVGTADARAFEHSYLA